jgi:hypothetical protein
MLLEEPEQDCSSIRLGQFIDGLIENRRNLGEIGFGQRVVKKIVTFAIAAAFKGECRKWMTAACCKNTCNADLMRPLRPW